MLSVCLLFERHWKESGAGIVGGRRGSEDTAFFPKSELKRG